MSAVDWGGMWRPERSPLETVLRAVIVYVFVHLCFRLVGRKELGQHSTYEIVLLFFVGVAMRQSIVGPDRSLTTAIIGFGALVACDAILAGLARRSPRAATVIDGPVILLLRDGQMDERRMRRARVSREQLLASVRSHGGERLEEVHRAYLERSGHISVVFRDPCLPRGPARDRDPRRPRPGLRRRPRRRPPAACAARCRR